MLAWDELSRLVAVPLASCVALLGLFSALLFGTACRGFLTLWRPGSVRARDWLSLGSWWLLLVLFSSSLLLGRWGIWLLMLTASFLGLNELRGPTRQRYGRALITGPAWIVAGFTYLCVAVKLQTVFEIGVPLAAIGLLPLLDLLHGRVRGFIQQTGGACWSVLLLTYCLAHVVWLWDLETSCRPEAGPAGLVLFLILLTQVNDIGQAIWGRWLGRHPITPVVSPHKTWEGFWGGLLTTLVIGLLIAPWLTPVSRPSHETSSFVLDLNIPPYGLTLVHTLPVCLLIALGGFFGDITLSAVKRDLGIKDSGTLLPGQGGILDRIDSLTFTAPLFYYYMKIFYAD